jgi:hypothetical protein
MKYTNRLVHYGGVCLLAIGAMFAPPSALTTALLGGLISYFPLSIFVWVIFGVLMGNLYVPVTALPRLDFSKISLFLMSIGAAALITGAVVDRLPIAETGIFLLLVGVEFYVTRHEWTRERKAS